MMRVKEYVMLATLIRVLRDDIIDNYESDAVFAVDRFAADLAEKLKADDPHFDWAKFIDVCGVT